MSICAVILAGGSGSRLWPLSRSAFPKQFLNLVGQDSMLQSTVKRLAGLAVNEVITICNEEHRFYAAEQLRQINKLGPIILEPIGRDTAPAIALGALSREDDPLLLILSADHVIKDQSAFDRAINAAVPLAEAGKLVTFGIVPNEPNTGYGYIRRGKSAGVGFVVDAFVEKPSFDLAKEYIDSGEYYWNSGMFLFRASVYLSELRTFRPEIYKACEEAMMDVRSDLDFFRIAKEKFEGCVSESVDYAVMENTRDAVVVPMNADWSDVGTWSSLWSVSEKDGDDNFTSGDVILSDVNGCYVRSDDKLVTAIGVNDLVIVCTKDSVLVADRDSVQDIKAITQKLKLDARSELEFHQEVSRPWGKYDSIDHGEGYQVKRITVKPGAKLSVQLHNHRAEHWVVVSGLARVTNGAETFLLSENESTYIPLGVIHALENPGEIDLELIEIQTGTYLGEDDIVRFEDRYGRDVC